MIKQYLGIITFSTIISLICFFSSYKLAKNKIKLYEEDVTYFGDYASSLLMFIFISSLILLFSVYIYLQIPFSSYFINSGLAFLIIEIIAGIIINFLHWLIFKFLCHLSKCKDYYHLKEHEITWTWLIICTIYGTVYWFCKEYEISCTYWVIVVSYFFWLGVNPKSLKIKLSSFYSLSYSYIVILIFIFLCAISVIRYKTDLQRFLFMLGVFIAIVICLFLLYRQTNKKISQKQI